MKKLLSILLAAVLLLSLCTAAAAESGGMRYSDVLVKFIEQEEGFSAQPYNDGTGWYIGYGCSCDPEEYPDGITEAEADQQVRARLELYAGDVNSFLSRYGLRVTQGQFDAMCDMTYNFGASWMNPGNRLPSYLIHGIDLYSDEQIASAFGAWSHFNGQVSEPLLRRRIKELKMFLSDDYSFTYDGWSWLVTDAAGGEQDGDITLYRTGSPYGSLPVAAMPGMYFVGWQKEDGTLLTAAETAQENYYVTAVWSASPEDAAPAEMLNLVSVPAVEDTLAIEIPEDVTPSFPDVPEHEWFAPYVGLLEQQGVLGGYEDGTFRPYNHVSWGEALKLVLRTAGFPEKSAPEGSHWAEGYRLFAAERGYLKGHDGVDLNAAITREEIADLCASALELSEAPEETAAGVSPYADSESGSAIALYNAGILEGTVENGQRMFRGSELLNRAGVSAILARMLRYVDNHFVFVLGQRSAIDYSLRMNTYDTDAFRSDTEGRLVYEAEGQTARYGIDVSYYQGDINWNAVAADGVDFAMIRCGFRGYGGDGKLKEDEKFRQNITGALSAGLDVGIYFFSQAITLEEAREEAELTLKLIRGYDIKYPVVFDWEQMNLAGSRTANPDWDMVTDCTLLFCDIMSSAGYTPMTYFNKSAAYLKLDMERLQAYDGWLAWYHDYCDYIYDFQMWQYGSSGKVNGINGRVDMNICFKDYSAL